MSNTINYSYYLKILLARKGLFLAVALGVMTLGFIIAYSLPKKFQAESTVFIEQNVITDLVKGIAVTPSVDAKLKMLSVSLLSRTMLLKVVRELDKDLTLSNDKKMEEYLAEINKKIAISYKEKQGVFKISFSDKNPIFARDFVNTLTRKYIDENTSSKRDESLDATKFLAEQIETFKRRIDSAEEAINRFKEEKGYILATDDVYLRGEISNGEKKLEELSIKRSELESKKRVLLERGADPGKLAEAESRLSELLARYTEGHPKVVRARAEVASLRSGGNDSTKLRTSSSTQENARILQVEIDAYKEMEARQARLIEESRNLLREMPSIKTTLAELVRKKDNENVIYQQLVSRYGQSEVSKQMELQDKSITFRVLDPAVTPLIPVSPNRLLIVFCSILAGLGAGFGVLLGLDVLKGGVKSLSDLKNLGIPVFAVVPHVIDCAAETASNKKNRILIGLVAGYVLFILAFATADTLRLQDGPSAVVTTLTNRIKNIVSN